MRKGAGSRPPSLPIWRNGGASAGLPCGLPEGSAGTSVRLEPLTMRQRYLRPDFKGWRGFTVDANDVAEKLLHPRGMRAVPGRRIQQRSIGAEAAVLDH